MVKRAACQQIERIARPTPNKATGALQKCFVLGGIPKTYLSPPACSKADGFPKPLRIEYRLLSTATPDRPALDINIDAAGIGRRVPGLSIFTLALLLESLCGGRPP